MRKFREMFWKEKSEEREESLLGERERVFGWILCTGPGTGQNGPSQPYTTVSYGYTTQRAPLC
jgi:hypothetical protein